jgi:hypothetical protein
MGGASVVTVDVIVQQAPLLFEFVSYFEETNCTVEFLASRSPYYAPSYIVTLGCKYQYQESRPSNGGGYEEVSLGFPIEPSQLWTNGPHE